MFHLILLLYSNIKIIIILFSHIKPSYFNVLLKTGWHGNTAILKNGCKNDGLLLKNRVRFNRYGNRIMNTPMQWSS